MKILVLDNYDSFTYNLVYLLRELGFGDRLTVARNNKIQLDEISIFDKILISPGPGLPESAGILKDLVSEYCKSKSILGICLGHQGIAEVFGAQLYNMDEVLHGIPDEINVLDPKEILFKGLPGTFKACHYHSWTVQRESINGELHVTAVDSEDRIMAITHTKYDVKGLQFHPESILTMDGLRIIDNWVNN